MSKSFDDMVVLALDIASCTGFAVGRIGQPKPEASGSITFGRGKGAPRCEKGAHMVRWMNDMFKVHSPDVISIEAPLSGHARNRGQSNENATRLALGMIFLAESLGELKGCRVSERPVQTVRKFFIGHGNLKGEVAKACVFDKCAFIGCNPGDDNESDAIALWSFEAVERNPSVKALMDELHRKGA